MLFNEPKLLKFAPTRGELAGWLGFSALQRAEIAEIQHREHPRYRDARFSALQRAEIAEIVVGYERNQHALSFSALQRAEIAEMEIVHIAPVRARRSFSALQRAEIAEIVARSTANCRNNFVSVLFNEPKLLKSSTVLALAADARVSVLFNEPKLLK